MILTLLILGLMLYAALQLQDRLNIPSPVSLIALSLLVHQGLGGHYLLAENTEQFATLVILLLPILLISDSLELNIRDLKAHAWSLFYLAVVAVALSVVVAILLADTLFASYHLSMAAVILLFAMVLATDPVSVVSIFSKFDLPHRLKILCEGESLFNDATALIVFVFIGLYALEGGAVTAGYVAQTSVMVVGGSVVIGWLVGYVGLWMLKTTHNRMAELLILILTGYGAFEVSEHIYVILNWFGAHSHLHLSGILATIIATVTLHHTMIKSSDYHEMRMVKEEVNLTEGLHRGAQTRNLVLLALSKIKSTVAERDRHMRSKEDVQLLAIVANTMLFVAMAEVVNLTDLWHYRHEIVVMFLATTLIRAVMMAKFAWISHQTEKMTNMNFRWWGVLTFAGIKGGLSIVMLLMIPASFEHLEMFQAVVIGVIMLSTFIYSAILLAIILNNRAIFKQELQDEDGAH
ncbi:MAG: cation:proton antiporter [Zetaproteobacteria bacterium]|nr:cation:proton antiporter [Zetaproteobacteria bacterium]